MIKNFLSLPRIRASGRAIAASSGAGLGQAVAAGMVDALTGAEPVTRVLLLPMGDIVLRGHSVRARLDDLAHAEAVVAASLKHAGRTELMIDYDHQSFYSVGPGKGGNARAAGWIKHLSADAQGIWGDVEWTPAAAAALTAREYRYISPLFYPARDGRVALLRNAGLVNEPAIESLPAVAASLLENDTVNYAKIAAALGLPDTATEEEIVAAIGAIAIPVPAEQMAMAAAALKLSATAGLGEIIAAAAAVTAEVDPSKFVPLATYETLRSEVAVLKGDRHAGVIAAAIGAGKLAPAEQAWAAGYIAKDEAGFNAMLAARPVIVPAGEIAGEGALAAAVGKHGLNATEMAVAANMGITPETFAETKKG